MTLDRGILASKLPKKWTNEGVFLDRLRQVGKVRPSDNATLSAVRSSLFAYGLLQYRRDEHGERQLRAIDPVTRERELVEARRRFDAQRIVKIPDEFGTLRKFPAGEAAEAEWRRVRGIKARAELAALDRLRADAAY